MFEPGLGLDVWGLVPRVEVLGFGFLWVPDRLFEPGLGQGRLPVEG
jgi:hypothetical protein